MKTPRMIVTRRKMRSDLIHRAHYRVIAKYGLGASRIFNNGTEQWLEVVVRKN